MALCREVKDARDAYMDVGKQSNAGAIAERCPTLTQGNPALPSAIRHFASSDPEYVKGRVFEIFAAATGASNVKYTGKDMKAADTSMNINEMEFNAVVDDVLAVCEKHKAGQKERNEVLAILWSVRKDIVNSHIITDSLVN